MNKEKRHIRIGLTNILLTLGMAFALTIFMPGSILEVRADDPVAKIGETTYDTLQAAVNVAQPSDIIVLQRNAVGADINSSFYRLAKELRLI